MWYSKYKAVIYNILIYSMHTIFLNQRQMETKVTGHSAIDDHGNDFDDYDDFDTLKI